MKDTRAIGKMAIVGIIIIVIGIAGIVGYCLTIPPTPTLKDALVMGTTDYVETSLDPANPYDCFGWEIIRSLGSGLVDYRAGATGPSDTIADLATAWSVSADAKQWTFTLRLGSKLGF